MASIIKIGKSVFELCKMGDGYEVFRQVRTRWVFICYAETYPEAMGAIVEELRIKEPAKSPGRKGKK